MTRDYLCVYAAPLHTMGGASMQICISRHFYSCNSPPFPLLFAAPHILLASFTRWKLLQNVLHDMRQRLKDEMSPGTSKECTGKGGGSRKYNKYLWGSKIYISREVAAPKNFTWLAIKSPKVSTFSQTLFARNGIRNTNGDFFVTTPFSPLDIPSRTGSS